MTVMKYRTASGAHRPAARRGASNPASLVDTAHAPHAGRAPSARCLRTG